MTIMRDIKKIRAEINEIDEKLIGLFKRRMACSREVGFYKLENNIPVLDEKREKEILDKVCENGGEYSEAVRALFSKMMELSRAVQYDIIKSAKEEK